MYLLFNSSYCCSYYIVAVYLILSFLFQQEPLILIMRFKHEPLARILRATSIPRNDFNKFNKLTSVFYSSVLLLIRDFVITLSK